MSLNMSKNRSSVLEGQHGFFGLFAMVCVFYEFRCLEQRKIARLSKALNRLN